MTESKFKKLTFERITGEIISNTNQPSERELKLLDFIYEQELQIIEITKTYAQEIEAASCFL
ncbi:hypothetical protein [Marinicellulosiphila megalodicopiae]|uniref:hypothetical protein n=1 Tax=Marinicellulosiphila megalodicopiae TaxID=2724896 RepID=UPI003BB1B5DA